MSISTSKNNCCGCTACQHICPTNAISMQEDEEGFSYPFISNDLCIECSKCEKVCSFQNGYGTEENFQSPLIYGVKAKSDETRMSSSSGGLFTTISDFILKENGVIYGVAYDKNFNVVHKRATTESERNAFRTSKYVQSDLTDIFKQIKTDLTAEKLVLFSGTPCQCSGLKEFLHHSNCSLDSLYICDIICHGTPSKRIYKEHLNYLESKYQSKITKVNFRDKRYGIAVLTTEFNNDKIYVSSANHDWFYNMFYWRLSVRPSCHHCIYTNYKRCRDITLADFWGIENYKPEFYDSKGVSLALVNTPKGSTLFSACSQNLHVVESTMKECWQPNLEYPSVAHKNREKFWTYYYKKGYTKASKKFATITLKTRVKDLIVKILKIVHLYDIVKALKVKLLKNNN